MMFTPYRPRPVRFLELWEPTGWRIKVDGISYAGEQPRAELVQVAKAAAARQLAAATGH